MIIFLSRMERGLLAGVSLGTSFDAVKASLGQPTTEKRDELTYGGIKFGHSLMQDSRPIVWYMTVSNRDAVTARGIAVGDTLKKVMDIYGRPENTCSSLSANWIKDFLY